jgi:hypothetical protein
MAQFSRRTVLAASDIIGNWSHQDIDRFLLEHALENVIPQRSRAQKGMAIARHLVEHPDAVNEDGANLTDTIVGAVVAGGIERSTHGYPVREFHLDEFQNNYSALHRGLERDGFTLDGGILRRALPQALALPAADDEVHALLNQYGLAVPLGHLDQGITAHAAGNWAAANAQFRAFMESLFDEIAAHINAVAPGLPATGFPRQQWLAHRNPPFFITALNEWTDQGTGFINGFYRRLHPAGAHPGLSDQDDSTFRLHMVLLVARMLLRRI